MNQPIRISVITPTFNRAATLGAAIESVRDQGVDGVEHIIVDAASTDGTAELLRGYDHLIVVSEPDRGIYDGMNKGLNMARGEVLVILNSDDVLLPGALKAWLAAFDADPEADMVSASAELVDLASGEALQVYDAPQNRALDGCEALLGLPIINARAFTGDLWRRLNGFDLRFPLVADREWLVRAVLEGARNVSIAAVLYRYQSHAGSATYASDMSAAKCLAYARENTALAASLAALTQLPRVRRAARILNDKSSATACFMALKLAKPGAFVAAIGQGFSLNPMWPASVAAMAMARMFRLNGLRGRLEGCAGDQNR